MAPLISITGHADTYMFANRYFDTMEDMKEAFVSETGQKSAADSGILEPGDDDAQIYLFEAKEVWGVLMLIFDDKEVVGSITGNLNERSIVEVSLARKPNRAMRRAAVIARRCPFWACKK